MTQVVGKSTPRVEGDIKSDGEGTVQRRFGITGYVMG